MHGSVEPSTGSSGTQYVTYHDPELYLPLVRETNRVATVLENIGHMCFPKGDDLVAADSVSRSHTACLEPDGVGLGWSVYDHIPLSRALVLPYFHSTRARGRSNNLGWWY